VQVDPTKSTLKAPGTERLKLKYDEPPLEFAFKFNLRCYTVDGQMTSIMLGLGRAVKVDPMKPKLKPPGTSRLKLKCDILLSNSTFEFNMRRWAWANCTTPWSGGAG